MKVTVLVDNIASPTLMGEWGLSFYIEYQGSRILLDAGASENTKKKFRDSCAFYGCELIETAPDRLGFAIGKPGRMCAAIAKGPLGDKLHTLAQQG